MNRLFKTIKKLPQVKELAEDIKGFKVRIDSKAESKVGPFARGESGRVSEGEEVEQMTKAKKLMTLMESAKHNKEITH